MNMMLSNTPDEPPIVLPQHPSWDRSTKDRLRRLQIRKWGICMKLCALVLANFTKMLIWRIQMLELNIILPLQCGSKFLFPQHYKNIKRPSHPAVLISMRRTPHQVNTSSSKQKNNWDFEPWDQPLATDLASPKYCWPPVPKQVRNHKGRRNMKSSWSPACPQLKNYMAIFPQKKSSTLAMVEPQSASPTLLSRRSSLDCMEKEAPAIEKMPKQIIEYIWPWIVGMFIYVYLVFLNWELWDSSWIQHDVGSIPSHLCLTSFSPQIKRFRQGTHSWLQSKLCRPFPRSLSPLHRLKRPHPRSSPGMCGLITDSQAFKVLFQLQVAENIRDLKAWVDVEEYM